MMKDYELLKRITFNRVVFEGKPFVRGHRVTVEQVLSNITPIRETDSILTDRNGLKKEDIQACLVYARKAIRNEDIEIDPEVSERHESDHK